MVKLRLQFTSLELPTWDFNDKRLLSTAFLCLFWWSWSKNMRFIRHLSYIILPNVFVYESRTLQKTISFAADWHKQYCFSLGYHFTKVLLCIYLCSCVYLIWKERISFFSVHVYRVFISIHIYFQKWSLFSWPFTYVGNLETGLKTVFDK